MPEVSDFNAGIIEEFRANAGKVGGMFEGTPMLLLTTTGAKSGLPRTSPLVYLRDGDRTYIFASDAGAPTNPGWYHNLVADPIVGVELGEERFEAKAEVLTGHERDEIYAKQVALFGFGDYQAKTERTIPVVELVRVS